MFKGYCESAAMWVRSEWHKWKTRENGATEARKLNFPIVNPDSIRIALHGHRYLPEAEPMVWTLAKYMVRSLFLAGHKNVIVDATNITQKRRDMWASPEWECRLIHISTSAEDCTARAIKDQDFDIVPVIERMAADFEDPNCCDGEY